VRLTKGEVDEKGEDRFIGPQEILLYRMCQKWRILPGTSSYAHCTIPRPVQFPLFPYHSAARTVPQVIYSRTIPLPVPFPSSYRSPANPFPYHYAARTVPQLHIPVPFHSSYHSTARTVPQPHIPVPFHGLYHSTACTIPQLIPFHNLYRSPVHYFPYYSAARTDPQFYYSRTIPQLVPFHMCLAQFPCPHQFHKRRHSDYSAANPQRWAGSSAWCWGPVARITVY
jgi:hypothetical protein